MQDTARLEATLAATLEVVEVQRHQLQKAQEELELLRLELESERRSREAAEEKLRDASVDFARKLSQMQARVLEAERDVVLGGQVLVARSRIVSATLAEGPPRVAGETPRRLVKWMSRASAGVMRRAQVSPRLLERVHGAHAPLNIDWSHWDLMDSADARILPSEGRPSEELEEVEQSLKEGPSSKQKKFWSVAAQARNSSTLSSNASATVRGLDPDLPGRMG
eukprot:symbB.v1.2.027497.t5/scaffold2828.1/size70857/2